MTEVLILGVILSIVFYELTDVTPGGIIVPGLLVVYINQPLRILYTVAIAIASYYIIKLLSRRFLIFGKRRFALLIITCLLLHFLFNLVFGLFMSNTTGTLISIAGYTVAGIIANNMFRQGVVKTVGSLAVMVCLLELIVIILTQTGVML